MIFARALSALLELTKARITFFVTLSVATGYLLFSGRFEMGMVLPMAGVFVLACGSAALNQVQEWRLDARMPRTKGRPIPSGRIASDWATLVALVLLGAGCYLLSLVERHTLVVLGLGVLSVVWYNGLYLWLKRVTAFAVVPGSVVGAIPPMIGWCAAGGRVDDLAILEVAFFFFLWQIPHFWLLMQKYGREYEAADMPSPTRLVSEAQFRRITFVWVLAVAATGLVIAARVPLSVPFNLLALVASLWLVFAAVGAVRRPGGPKASLRLFLQINLYALAMMILLSANALARGAA